MLDNNKLINLKAKFGVSAPRKNTTALYLKARLLERELKKKLVDKFDYSIDLEIFVDKILEKTNTVVVCEVILDHLSTSDAKCFVKEASKIKSFMIKMKKLAGEVEKQEDLDDNEFYRCEEEDIGSLEDLI